MLEESIMDKKLTNRISQPQSRASAVDCKKNSELTRKPWPRNNKKRENSGNVPKNESCRKNVSATRGRGQVDKRPRPRGDSEFVMGGTTDTGVAEPEPELGSVFVPGSKKQNFNHLLNFMYSPRGTVACNRGPPMPRRYNQMTMQKYSLDQYLLTSCQFVVKEDGDYSMHLVDPDKLTEWNQIVEVVVRSTGCAECPICLGAPVAGRVGRCGHVYCWPCALHYAATHDHQPPPCPVCTAPFRVDQMKPARIIQWESPREEVSMRLVRRLRGSTIVEVAPSRKENWKTPVKSIKPLDQINQAPYCKLFTANVEQVQDILKRERQELQAQILAEIDTSEVVYMERALDMLKTQENNIISNNMKLYNAMPQQDGSIEPVLTVYDKQTTTHNKIDWFEVTGDETPILNENVAQDIEDLSNILEQSNLNPEAKQFAHKDVNKCNADFPLSETLNEEEAADELTMLTDLDKENKSKYFYFYQAEDGQQVFLDKFNIRLLNTSWGALVAAPPVISGRVLRRESLSVSEQTRKHFPCVSHLPIHCPFDVVEIDLQLPYVTTGALKFFKEELGRRAQKRIQEQKKELRRELYYKRQLEGPPKPDFSSEIQFPPTSPPMNCSPPLDVPFLSAPVEVTLPSTSGVVSSSSGLSFAKMASSSGTWRARPTRVPTPPPPDDTDQSAPRTLSLSDAIEAALHAGPSVSKGRKKKSKQKVLFATGMQRAA